MWMKLDTTLTWGVTQGTAEKAVSFSSIWNFRPGRRLLLTGIVSRADTGWFGPFSRSHNLAQFPYAPNPVNLATIFFPKFPGPVSALSNPHMAIQYDESKLPKARLTVPITPYARSSY